MSRLLLALLLMMVGGAARAQTPAAGALPAAPASGKGQRVVIEEREVTVGGRSWRRIRLSAQGADGQRMAEGIVWLWSPPHPIGFALALPGWKLPVMDYEREMSLAAVAEKHRLALVLAEMHTTVYEAGFFPESRGDRKWCGADCEIGGLAWLAAIVLPFGRSRYGDFLGTLGLSTGGRGAVSVAQFAAPGRPACAASGTFDLFGLAVSTGEYRIHAQMFGERRRYAKRWSAHDNVRRVANGIRSPMLLLHGERDESVPSVQSRRLAEAMSQAGGDVTLEIVPGAAHDWRFWSAVMPRCVEFIARHARAGLP